MPVRVLLAAMPHMLHDIVHDAFVNQPSLQVVAELVADDDISAAAERYDADVVVMPSALQQQQEVAEQILFTRPRLRLLMLTADGRAAQLYRLIPHKMTIDDVSAEQLVNAILPPPNG